MDADTKLVPTWFIGPRCRRRARAAADGNGLLITPFEQAGQHCASVDVVINDEDHRCGRNETRAT
jgi:hypothetical protein